MANVAFWTVGDNRRFLGGRHGPRTSAIYQRVAQHLAPGHANGVRTISAAVSQLQSLARGSIERFFFVGHGYNNGRGGYFFTGRANSTSNWTASGNQVFTSPQTATDANAQLIAEIKRVAADHPTQVHLYFLCCYVGGSSLPARIARAMEQSPHSGAVHSTARYNGIDVSWTGTGRNRTYTPTGYHRAIDERSPPISGTQTHSLDVFTHLDRVISFRHIPAVLGRNRLCLGQP